RRAAAGAQVEVVGGFSASAEGGFAFDGRLAPAVRHNVSSSRRRPGASASLVIPAEAGIPLLVRHPGGSRDPFAVVLVAFRENRLTSLCGLVAIHGDQSLSFACAKESNQRKHTSRPRSAGIHARGLRERARGPDAAPPCADTGRARTRAPARVRCTRPFPPPARRGREGPGKSKKRGSPCRRSRSHKETAKAHQTVIPAKAGIHVL